jgi:membrane protein required for beta-lactamase induction
LLYCLGPDDLDTQTADFINAQEQGDEDKAKQLTQALCQCEPSESAAERMRQVREAIFVLANQRIFAVILWFLVLGPLGAVLYRFARQLARLQRADEEAQVFNQGVQRLIFILDWLPARVMAFTFALAGNFENTLYRWRNWSSESSDGTPAEARDLLINVGDGALKIEKGDDNIEEDESASIEAALSLIWRTLVIWLVLIGLIDLAL